MVRIMLSQMRTGQHGFTLTELLVAIAVLGLTMTGLLTLLMSGNQSYLTGSNQAEAQAATRAALEQMTGEIRGAGYDTTGAGFASITNQTNTQFTIQNDWNGNGAIENGITVCMTYSWAACPNPGGPNNRGEQITYTMVPVGVTFTLCRQESSVGPPNTAPCPAPRSQPLVTNVVLAAVGANCTGAPLNNPPLFQFCDATDNPTGVSANIRTIVVNFRVGVQAQTPGSFQTGAVQVTMSDRISLRNR